MNKDQEIVILTEKAISQIKEIVERDCPPKTQGLRVGVIGGGCSGLSYDIQFSDHQENDNIIKLDFIDVLIDPKSSIYLKGVTLDFKDGLDGKGFVFINPNATNTCGCGESFSI